MKTFTTERLHLAIYLHATGFLELMACKQSRPGRQCFEFVDPDQRSDELEFQFDNGGTAPASSLFASQTYLRRLMSRTTNKEKTENREEDNANYQHHRG
jgi:hypothetical protein